MDTQRVTCKRNTVSVVYVNKEKAYLFLDKTFTNIL